MTKKSKFKNMNVKDKRILIVTIVSILSLLLLVSTSFALFMSRGETEEKTLYETGDITINFDDSMGSAINLDPAKPMSFEVGSETTPYTFTIENTGTYTSSYEIYLNELDGTTLSNDLIKVLINDELYTLSELENNLLKESIIYPGQTLTFELRIWLDESATVEGEDLVYKGQIAVSGKALNVDSSGANAPELVDDMIPVVYDESKNAWIKADTSTMWYNYDEGMWANAVIVRDTVPEWDGVTGDVNFDGRVDIEDGDYIMSHMFETITLSSEQIEVAAGLDGITSYLDAGDYSALLSMLSNMNASPVGVSKTSKSKAEYLAAPAGTVIDKSDIEKFLVWIPRFKYRINNTGTTVLPSEIDIVFESGTESTGVDINTTGVATTEYYTHPAFRDGSSVYKTTAYDQGGWDSELTGFWVEKFKMTFNFMSIPYDTMITGDTIGNYITDYVSYENPYTNSHMLKNTEWGAIAYLSQSKYGKMGNDDYSGSNKEIYINNSSNGYTGKSAGAPSGVLTVGDLYSGNALVNSRTYATYGFYSYNNYFMNYYQGNPVGIYQTKLSGVGASTTGTIYGVYDMSGGRDEYVMANYNNSLANSNFTEDYFTNEDNKKYYDSYSSDKTYILGDATYETSGWYSDNATYSSDDSPFIIRGGNYNSGEVAGIFNFTSSTGDESTNSYRLVVTP